jgi:hypothetical protein
MNNNQNKYDKLEQSFNIKKQHSSDNIPIERLYSIDTSDDLFHEQEKITKQFVPIDDSISWIKANFFLTDQRILFGTWNGVFTTVLLNLFSVIIFVRIH